MILHQLNVAVNSEACRCLSPGGRGVWLNGKSSLSALHSTICFPLHDASSVPRGLGGRTSKDCGSWRGGEPWVFGCRTAIVLSILSVFSIQYSTAQYSTVLYTVLGATSTANRWQLDLMS